MCTGGVTFDPDLQQAYERASRVTSVKGQAVGLASTQQVQIQGLVAEQERRNNLRAANQQLADQRQSVLTQVAEQKKEAEVQQRAETQRQDQLQQQAEQDRIAQEEQIGRESTASQAMSQSMQVLSRAGKSTTAPTAQVTRGRAPTRVRGASGSQGLRIGSSAAAPGTGLNIGS